MSPLGLQLSYAPGRSRQRGATLVVGLIMLAVITLIVVGAFSLSYSNLQVVGNMQVREEAIAASNQATEQVINAMVTGTNAATMASTTMTPIAVDINNDGTTDYSVQPSVACIRAIKASSASPSDVELSSTMSSGAYWYVDMDIQADVTDAATGARAQTHQGIRMRVAETDKISICGS